MTNGVAGIRRRNVAEIVGLLARTRRITRAEIASRTGLSPGAVTRLTRPLVAAGVLVEKAGEHARIRTGRPSIPLELDPDSLGVAALHLGTRYVRAGVANLAGEVIEERVVTHGGAEPERVVDAAAALLEDLGRRTPGRRLVLVAASTGGEVDHERGVLADHAALGWHGVPLRGLLEARLGRPVIFDSTVRGMALAELWLGSGDARCLVNLLVGNVIGAALVIDGKLHSGAGSRAGGLAHLRVSGRSVDRCGCGGWSCLEAVASGQGMLAFGRARGVVGASEDMGSVLTRARRGDRAADQLLRRQAGHVGEACRVLLDLLDPDAVILCGWYTKAAEYLQQVRAAAGDCPEAQRIRPQTVAGPELLVGTAALALDRYFSDPLAYGHG